MCVRSGRAASNGDSIGASSIAISGSSKITGTVSGTVKAGAKILWTIGRYWVTNGPLSSDRGSS